MSQAQEEAKLDLHSIPEVFQDYKLLQARNSKPYVATMADVCDVLNGLPIGRMTNIDVDDLKNQTGHILFYAVKDVDSPVPVDIEYVPSLHSHFRRPTILVLKRVQKFLMGPHRRVLGRLEREQALEKVMNMTEFDVSKKIRLCLDEINRYQSMAKMVRGGGRKLDILMQALQIPSRTRFELVLVRRILGDEHHPRHREAMKWLKESKFKGNVTAIKSLISNGFQLLDSAVNKLLDLMEELSGLQFPRDVEDIDLNRNWYSLGAALPRGEDFVKTFTADENVEQKIKRLTYPMVRVGWDADRLQATKDRLMVDIANDRVQAAQLANLFFELEKKIRASTKPDGEVLAAIQTDFENGMLNSRERDEAEKWVRKNKIKLQELIMDVYATLQSLKEKNPKIALPEQLEATIEKIKSGHDDERDAHRQDVASEINQVTVDDLAKAVAAVDKRLDKPDADLLKDICELRDRINQRIDGISINNIEFHKKVREAYQDFDAYENKVMELYQMEERLDQLRMQCEDGLINCYRNILYAGVAPRVLSRSAEVIMERMLIALRKLDYSVIDADMFQSLFDKAADMDVENAVAHLEQLLVELEAAPRSEQLLSALHDWERDLGAEKIKEKEAYLLENETKLQEIADKARAELREHLNGHPEIKQSRRLRFEVFGLADCLADSLAALLNSSLASAPKVANVQEGEQLIRGLETLEAQIIQAQKDTKPGGSAHEKLDELEKNGQLTKELSRELRREMELNFTELDQLLEETSQGLKRVKALQNRFGGEKETDYLDVTLNINDLERLKDVYDFIETVTMEDSKRFCVAYNLKTGLLNNLFEMARKKDLSVSQEIMQHFSGKAYKLFKEKRFIQLPLRTVIMKNSSEAFEAECQLLCHTLNLVNPSAIRKKASYLMVMALLGQAKNADHQIVKLLGLLWGRIQTRIFNFKPKNHPKNFEGNRQALLTDVKELVGDKFKR